MIDDHLVLLGQIGVENKSFFSLFSTQQVSFYRPVGHVLLWISYRLFAENCFYYHLTNLILFIIIVCLFYKISESLSSNRQMSLIAALLFAFHPINSMLVNYITANVISTFVITQQLSLISFIRCLTVSRPDNRSYALSLLFFLLSLLSHEMAIIFPMFLIAAMYFKFRLKWQAIFRSAAPFILGAGFYLMFRMYYFPLVDTIKGAGLILPDFSLYLSSAGMLVNWYITKLIVPTGIIYFWSHAALEQVAWIPLATLVSIFLFSAYLIFWRWQQGIKPLALSIFLLGLLPVFLASFTYQSQKTVIIEPHWFYFSSIGFFILIAHYITQIKISRAGTTIIVIALGCLYFGLLQKNNAHWRSQETYCRYWISLNQTNATPFYWLGKSLSEAGEYEQAMAYFNQALITPGFSSMLVLTDLAYAQFKSGRRKEGKQYLERAAQFGPNYSVLYYYLSQIYVEEHDHKKAREMLRTALKLFPRNKKYQEFWLSINSH